MDFDFSLVTAPFRMQPGLRRLDPAAPQLTPLVPGSPLWEEKQAVLLAGRSRLAVPGFDAEPALAAIARRAAQEGLETAHAGQPLELAFEQDLVVLDGRDGTLPWLCVCVPSHWAPEEKLGLPLHAVHAGVADNALLQAASAQLVSVATGGECWERFVWTLSPSGRHDQHPRRQPREPWPDAGTTDDAGFAARCWLRVERQTFFPVGGDTRQAVFTIRVMLAPLAEAAARPADARRLHDALASMSPAVLAYKNLLPAREPLLRWLAARAG